MYKQYIITDDQKHVIDYWSTGASGDRDTTGATCISEGGSYQFRFTPDGEENPPHLTPEGIPLYTWDGTRVMRRPDKDVQADIDALPKPEVTPDYIAFLRGLMGVES